ncbi:MAG: DoxX family protein [Candidatus Brennerbacteria bacterium]
MIQPLFLFNDWALLILRVALGVILVAHGYPKFRDLKGTAAWMGSVGLRPGIAFALVAAVLEVFGGLALIMGLLTQLVAVLVAVQLLVAMLKVNWTKGLVGGYEFDLILFAAAALLATTGGGLFGLDSTFGIFVY